MAIVNIHEAKTHFSKLVEKAMNGEEIIIGKSGKPVVKLIAIQAKKPKRVPKGFIELPVRISHTLQTLELLEIDSDPFDRILIAQAISEPKTFGIGTHSFSIQDPDGIEVEFTYHPSIFAENYFISLREIDAVRQQHPNLDESPESEKIITDALEKLYPGYEERLKRIEPDAINTLRGLL